MLAGLVSMRARSSFFYSSGYLNTWWAGALSFLFSLLIPVTSYGKSPQSLQYKVDLETLAFHVSLTIDHLFFDFDLNYNSRSLHDGMFGHGWCSSIDWKVEDEVLKHCDITQKRKLTKVPWGHWANVNELQLAFNSAGDLFAVVDREKNSSLQLGPLPLTFAAEVSGVKMVKLRVGEAELSLPGLKFERHEEKLSRISGDGGVWRFSYTELDNLERIASEVEEVRINYERLKDSVLSLSTKSCQKSFTRKKSLIVSQVCKDQELSYRFTYLPQGRRLSNFVKQRRNYKLTYDGSNRVKSVALSKRKLRLSYSSRGQRFPDSLQLSEVGEMKMKYSPGGGLLEAKSSARDHEAAREIRGFFNTFVSDFQPIIQDALGFQTLKGGRQ